MQPGKHNERTRDYTITDFVEEATADARKNLPVRKVFLCARCHVVVKRLAIEKNKKK